MDNTDLALHSGYLIKLLRASLNRETVGSIPADIDLKKVYYLAGLHSVVPAVYPAIKEISLPAVALFKEDYLKSWRKTAIQFIELSSILSKADEFQIDCIPLKGSILKELYPSPEMRTMADLDFLCNIKKIEDVKLIMYQLGYIPQSEYANHFVFYKEPLMNVEFHPELLTPPSPLADFVNPGWQFAVHTGRDKPMRSLTKEGFLIFLIAHTAYHFMNGGSGIRSVMDIWVYLKRYKSELDNITLNRELRHAKLLDFYNNLKSLSEVWFGTGEMTPKLAEFGDYIIKSCTYGTKTNNLNSKFGSGGNYKTNRRKYIISSAFPSYALMSGKYPLLKKHPVLLPFYWVRRIASVVLFKRKTAKIWLKDFSATDKEEVDKFNEMLGNLGLSQLIKT